MNHTGGPNSPAADLEGWWMALAQAEMEKVIPKAIEYGATDLTEIGNDLIAAGVEHPESETGRDELGIYFYIVGKMARWRDAIRRGEAVSDDTLHDIGVYVRMAQRIRDAGSWPGTPTGPTRPGEGE